ncbi:hypothetical protein JYT16_00560 [Gemmatimonas aurantiaca]|nr:hypothetical protein [Gemmatimonas aurantiaca]
MDTDVLLLERLKPICLWKRYFRLRYRARIAAIFLSMTIPSVAMAQSEKDEISEKWCSSESIYQVATEVLYPRINSRDSMWYKMWKRGYLEVNDSMIASADRIAKEYISQRAHFDFPSKEIVIIPVMEERHRAFYCVIVCTPDSVWGVPEYVFDHKFEANDVRPYIDVFNDFLYLDSKIELDSVSAIMLALIPAYTAVWNYGTPNNTVVASYQPHYPLDSVELDSIATLLENDSLEVINEIVTPFAIKVEGGFDVRYFVITQRGFASQLWLNVADNKKVELKGILNLGQIRFPRVTL